MENLGTSLGSDNERGSSERSLRTYWYDKTCADVVTKTNPYSQVTHDLSHLCLKFLILGLFDGSDNGTWQYKFPNFHFSFLPESTL